MFLSTCIYLYLSVYMFIYFVYLCIFIFIYLYLVLSIIFYCIVIYLSYLILSCRSIDQSIYLSVYLSIYLSIYLFMYLSLYLSLYQFLYLSYLIQSYVILYCLSIYLYIIPTKNTYNSMFAASVTCFTLALSECRPSCPWVSDGEPHVQRVKQKAKGCNEAKWRLVLPIQKPWPSMANLRYPMIPSSPNDQSYRNPAKTC